MEHCFKKNHRRAYISCLVLSFLSALIGLIYMNECYDLNSTLCTSDNPIPIKLISTSGLIATLAGIIQLEISGLFDKIFDMYNDIEKYPYGAPSYVTRQTIDNPDKPIQTKLRNILFFDMRTGFWLIVCGTIIQIIAIWL